jgi:hypothetical protein
MILPAAPRLVVALGAATPQGSFIVKVESNKVQRGMNNGCQTSEEAEPETLSAEA